jgi:hypothetical protein
MLRQQQAPGQPRLQQVIDDARERTSQSSRLLRLLRRAREALLPLHFQ